MQNNQWKIIGDQILTKSPNELKDNFNISLIFTFLLLNLYWPLNIAEGSGGAVGPVLCMTKIILYQ